MLSKLIKWGLLLVLGFFIMLVALIGKFETENKPKTTSGRGYSQAYNLDLPIYEEITGRGQIPDDVAKLAVAVGVKYRILPSVVISQWAYESAWGTSLTATGDNNFFGITWFLGAPYPQGGMRGIGGSEGGNYMKFPSMAENFNYYGYMVSSQSNFNQVVNNKSPGESLLILGRGGYAAAGITENSPYYTAAMSIIEKNNLTEYDSFAISKWGEYKAKGETSTMNGDYAQIFNTTYVVLQPYGYSPWSTGAGAWMYPGGKHTGVDVQAYGYQSADIPVFSMTNGTIVGNTSSQLGGNAVIVQTDFGGYLYYGHLKYPGNVQVGQEVKKGDQIGILGNSGMTDIYHVHLEYSTESQFGNGLYDKDPSFLFQKEGTLLQDQVINP